MICYAFPLAHEAAPLLECCTQKETFSIDRLHCTIANFGGRPILVALIGMGQRIARENTETLFRHFRPKAFVLAGYGGALVTPLKVGQVLISNNFSSPEVLPFLRLLNGFDFAGFSTADVVVGTPEERTRFARLFPGQVIEMETAAVAEIVREREIPFMALRVITDEYQHLLPVRALAAGFDPERGRPTPFRLLAHLALHWNEIRPFAKFVANLSVARKYLILFLKQLNEELPRAW